MLTFLTWKLLIYWDWLYIKLIRLFLIGKRGSSFLGLERLNLAYDVFSLALLIVWFVCFLAVIVEKRPIEDRELVKLKQFGWRVLRFRLGSWFCRNFIRLYFCLDYSDIMNAFLSWMFMPFFFSIVSKVFNCLSKPIFGITFLPFTLTYSIASLKVQFYFFIRYEITKVGAFITTHLLEICQRNNAPICFLLWFASLLSHRRYGKNLRRFRVCCPKAGKWYVWRSFGSNQADPCLRLRSRLC